MPAGRPASSISSPRRTGNEGSRSDGFRMKALPTAIATPNIHNGIIAGKLNGVMTATSPSDWLIQYTSMPGPAPWVEDRQSVVKVKRGFVRLDTSGCLMIKTKNQTKPKQE